MSETTRSAASEVADYQTATTESAEVAAKPAMTKRRTMRKTTEKTKAGKAPKAKKTASSNQQAAEDKPIRKTRAKKNSAVDVAPTGASSVIEDSLTNLAAFDLTTAKASASESALSRTSKASEAHPVSDEPAIEKTVGRMRRTRKVVTFDSSEAVASMDSSKDATVAEESTLSVASANDQPNFEADQRQDGQKLSARTRQMSQGKQSSSSKSFQSRKNSNRQNNQTGGKQSGSYRQNNNGYNNRRQQQQQRRPRQGQSREVTPSISVEELAKLKVADLRARAAELEVDVTGLKKAELVDAVFAAGVKAEGFKEVAGVLDILTDGYGFLRTQGYLPSETDAYVGLSTIRRNGLRRGDYVSGQTRPARENEKYAAIQKVLSINGVPIEQCGPRSRFADLTPVYPDERLLMEHGRNTITARVIDLAVPVGKGQRGLIVSPPKAGKTTVLKDIAASITANNPEVHLMCLLVDERPEEVTDMERSIHGEVISSTFDMPCENHIAVAELVIERAKRLVEGGADVVILLDSITRLARAYNLTQPASGRILSGGVDSTALYPPKRFLGAARNIEGGGSLTILGTALVDTGSKMDEVIFEEFKGTGNMELKLDRNLADRRIFPAIDPVSSGTRKEELLLDPQEAPLIWAVRRLLANMNSTERAMDMLIKSLKQTDTNQEFLMRTAKKAQHGKADESFEL